MHDNNKNVRSTTKDAQDQTDGEQKPKERDVMKF